MSLELFVQIGIVHLKRKGERHGKCDDCRKYHAESKRQRPVYREKEKKELTKLFSKYIPVCFKYASNERMKKCFYF